MNTEYSSLQMSQSHIVHATHTHTHTCWLERVPAAFFLRSSSLIRSAFKAMRAATSASRLATNAACSLSLAAVSFFCAAKCHRSGQTTTSVTDSQSQTAVTAHSKLFFPVPNAPTLDHTTPAQTASVLPRKLKPNWPHCPPNHKAVDCDFCAFCLFRPAPGHRPFMIIGLRIRTASILQ